MADTGYGILLNGATSTGFFAEIIGVTLNDQTREKIDTSHTATTSGRKTYIPSDLIDGGDLEVEINFNPATTIPIGAAPEVWTLTFGDSGTCTWAFTGFITSAGGECPLEDRMTATITLAVSGVITVTP
jgi:hypothetical protein